ncbi:MAG: Mitochondrial-processing peptidase subunit alpha [Chaenotheca gracillima]|nr:MAG: Mitochondrial-processing peptidase subunit alpha [Chaenotheca gracillima]
MSYPIPSGPRAMTPLRNSVQFSQMQGLQSPAESSSSPVSQPAISERISNPSITSSSPAAFHEQLLASLPEAYRRDYITRWLAPVPDGYLIQELERRVAVELEERRTAAGILMWMHNMPVGSTSHTPPDSNSSGEGARIDSMCGTEAALELPESLYGQNRDYDQQSTSTTLRYPVATESNTRGSPANAALLSPPGNRYQTSRASISPLLSYTPGGFDHSGRPTVIRPSHNRYRRNAEPIHAINAQGSNIGTPDGYRREASSGLGRPLPPIPTETNEDTNFRHCEHPFRKLLRDACAVVQDDPRIDDGFDRNDMHREVRQRSVGRQYYPEEIVQGGKRYQGLTSVDESGPSY